MATLGVIYNATFEFDPAASALALCFRLRPLPRPGQVERDSRIATYPECRERRVEPGDHGVVVETGSIAHAVRRLQINANFTVDLAPAAPMPEIAPRHDDLLSEDGRSSKPCDIASEDGRDMIRSLARNWTYDARVPPSMRPIAQLDVEKHGGCEDIARLAAAALRQRGIPVRYVVGYRGALDAPASRRRRRHAWLAFWSRDRGWCEIDPLNPSDGGLLVATAWGPTLPSLQPVSGTIVAGRVKRVSVEIQIVSFPQGDRA